MQILKEILSFCTLVAALLAVESLLPGLIAILFFTFMLLVVILLLGLFFDDVKKRGWK